ncbi:MAG: hypothetical protein ABIJ56_09145 [Pseudomonadota bacterium]
MSLFSSIEETEYFWADFFFSEDRAVPETMEMFHQCLVDDNMGFKLLKGNDCHLNYTILDRVSGFKWMIDLYNNLRAAKGKSERRHEYIMAAYNANFALPEYTLKASPPHVELDELLFSLQYNGKWVLRRETFSLSFFFCKDGILGAGENDFQQGNLVRAVDLCKKIWRACSPVFCWMDVSSQFYSEAASQISRGRVPSGAWFTISSKQAYTHYLVEVLENSRHLIYDYLEEKSLFIENTKCRRGKLKYL